ncbi:hypothetical protein ACLESO_16605 [Pyxidicoccus sp. 3LG]
MDAEAAALTRRYHEAQGEEARRAVLVAHLTETVKDRKERREDLRALDRWMGLDALRERLERKRHQLLVEEETALRCLAGVLRRLDAETRVTHATALASLAGELLGRAAGAPRAQNRLAALECFYELVRQEPASAAALTEAGATLSGLVGQEDTSPFFQAEALRSLLVTDELAGLTLLRQRLRGPYPSAKDFLFRRQALELTAPLLSTELLIPLLTEVATHDPSEFVRMGLCGLVASRTDGQSLLRHLAGLDGGTQSPRVRTAAVLAAMEATRQEAAVRESTLALLEDILRTETHTLVLRVACEQSAALAEALGNVGLGDAHARLTEAIAALRVRPETEGSVLEAAANAEQVLRRTADPARLAWTRYLAARVEKLRPGGRTQVSLEPLPEGLPPLPEEPAWLGAILADLSRDGYGLYAERAERTLTLWQGDRQRRRLWRILHELRTPAPNKRQAFQHTTGRVMPGTLRAHPGHLDEITETVVPGERVHVASQGGWGRHLPTVDDLLDLPLRAGGKVHLFSSHGTTVLVPPPSLARRLRNKLRVTRDYRRLSALRLDSLQGEEPRERRRFVEHVEKDLGVLVHFSPYGEEAPVPGPLSTLFGDPDARQGPRLHSPALVALESGWLAVLTERILENEGYFLGTGGNGVAALGIFTAALFTVFLGETYVKRQRVRNARAQVPLSIGGWGTRGKSGTERLKAALFTGLGFDVFAKTTGSEAMFVHSAPGGVPTEFFIFRPYDKATIWEQKDMVELGARLGTEVFLWECMALQPNFVELLQNDWMKDDYATLTNAYPDHEDIQGPAGMDVASVITKFMPKGGNVVTTEDHFLPLFQRAAKDGGTALHHSAWWEAELIPEELLALFPYREHPRNMALVATLGEQLGVPRAYALALMAEHVQPEIGVLKVFPSAKVRGRKLTFINGHSANERTGFLNNWRRTGLDTVEPETQPDRAVITVVNNRWDRVARSEVFARILVEDAAADRHVLIGTNLEGIQKYVRDALDRFLQRTEVVAAEDLQPGADAHRPEARLTRELARLKIPRPSPAAFLERLERYARGAGLTASRTPELVAAVQRALEAPEDALSVAKVREALEREVGPQLDTALRKAPARGEVGLRVDSVQREQQHVRGRSAAGPGTARGTGARGVCAAGGPVSCDGGGRAHARAVPAGAAGGARAAAACPAPSGNGGRHRSGGVVPPEVPRGVPGAVPGASRARERRGGDGRPGHRRVRTRGGARPGRQHHGRAEHQGHGPGLGVPVAGAGPGELGAGGAREGLGRIAAAGAGVAGDVRRLRAGGLEPGTNGAPTAGDECPHSGRSRADAPTGGAGPRDARGEARGAAPHGLGHVDAVLHAQGGEGVRLPGQREAAAAERTAAGRSGGRARVPRTSSAGDAQAVRAAEGRLAAGGAGPEPAGGSGAARGVHRTGTGARGAAALARCVRRGAGSATRRCGGAGPPVRARGGQPGAGDATDAFGRSPREAPGGASDGEAGVTPPGGRRGRPGELNQGQPPQPEEKTSWRSKPPWRLPASRARPRARPSRSEYRGTKKPPRERAGSGRCTTRASAHSWWARCATWPGSTR